jgi:hypothetical protein
MRASLLLVAFAGATACGGDAVRDAVDPVAQAAATTRRQTSAKLTIVAQGTIDGQPVRGTGTGLIQFRPGKVAVTMESTVAGHSYAGEEITDGTTLYMRVPPEGRRYLPAGKSWIKVDLDRATGGGYGAAMSQLQGPASMLELLQATTGAKAVGSEMIHGVRTTHHRGVIDYAAIAKSGPPALRKMAALTLKFSSRLRVPVEVWMDGQQRIRRLRMLVATKAIRQTPAQTQTITTDYTSYGVDTSGIRPPGASKTHDITDDVVSELGAGHAGVRTR